MKLGYAVGLIAAALAVLLCPAPALAQTVRILVGFAAGGGLDTLARVFGEKIAESTGRTVVVENRAGAGGRIAGKALVSSPADGSTLQVLADTHITIYPHTQAKPDYDIADFTPVAHLGIFNNGLVVGPNVRVNEFREWVAWAKADRKNAVFGSPTAGGSQHFLGLALGELTGVPLQHIAYKGVAPAVTDLVGGHLPVFILPMAQIIPLAKAGKIRVLAQTGTQRAAAAPDVPTFRELGYPTVGVSGWYMLVGPAGVPADVVRRYHDIVVRALRMEPVRERMRTLDLEISEMPPAEMAARLKAEYDHWRPIVKASGFNPDN